MTTKDPVPMLEFRLIPFTPSQGQEVADLNTIFYDKNKKRIVMRTENMVDTRKKAYRSHGNRENSCTLD